MANIDSKLNKLFGMGLVFIILFTWFTLFFYSRAQYNASGEYLKKLQLEQQRREDQQKRLLQFQRRQAQ